VVFFVITSIIYYWEIGSFISYQTGMLFMIRKLSIQQFVTMASHHPVIDVRSPGEYSHAYIQGAYSLPLFSDEERKVVGTAYKQQGRQKAIRIGLEYFGVKMRGMLDEVETFIGNRQLAMGKGQPVMANCILLYCWRGGMRSAGVAWLLDLYGYEVYTLVGGYKAYRNWVLQQFEKEYKLKIVGGYTGSGKTKVLDQLLKLQEPVIDLEALANHKGSAFGGIGQPKQPSQEMFDNLLATELERIKQIPEIQGRSIWIEDESQRIGVLNIPNNFWKTMRNQPVYFIDIPFSQRLDYILHEYGALDKQRLSDAIERIQKRLGPLETKTALAELEAGNIKECFRILLSYYDKLYSKGLHNRENIGELLNKIPCSTVDRISITEKLLSCATAET